MIIKEIALNGARVYYKYKSDMLIPTKVWEETRHLENQIFDAIPVESLAALMRQYDMNANRYR